MSSYNVKTKITRGNQLGSHGITIELEGAGFVGTAEGYKLGEVFEKAYDNLMLKVASTLFVED